MRVDVVDLIVIACVAVLVYGIVKSSTALITGAVAVMVTAIVFGAVRMYVRFQQHKKRALERKLQREDAERRSDA